MSFVIESYQSKGLRNDRGRKLISSDFVYDIENFNFDEVIGFKKIKAPSILYNSTTDQVDGIFKFKYLNTSGQFVEEDILVQGGNIIKNFLNTPTTIYSGMTPNNKCTFAILNDKLFISNGVDYILVYDGNYVTEMGAPTAKNELVAGHLTGQYRYAISYTINSVEIVIGTQSNIVSVNSNKITVDLPISIATCTERKLYRTEAGGTQLKLVTTIHDNTTLSFEDNVTDNSLGINIPTINSSCPKPKFITVKNEKLVGVGNSFRPNYLYVTEVEIEIFYNTSGVSDVSGVGNDNTPLTGLVLDYNQIVIFSEKHIYIADISNIVTTVRQTNANTGCINGYSIVRIPENSTFSGGVMFASNLYDIRVFNGNIATNLPTQLDNLKTNNFSEQLNKTKLKTELQNIDLHAEFYDYKYHIITTNYIFVYDIRINGWTKYLIKTDSYSPIYRIITKFGDDLFIAQKNAGIIEKMYDDVNYRGENITAFLETPDLVSDNNSKYFQNLYVHYDETGTNQLDVLVTVNNDQIREATVNYTGSFYEFEFYDPDYYLSSDDNESYKLVHIDRYGKHIRIKITCQTMSTIRGFKLEGRIISNKEL